MLPVSAEEVAEPKTFLWEVKSPTSTVYILGSIHFMKKEAYPLKDVLEGAFSRSNTLVVELNPLKVNQVQTQQLVLTKGVYKGGESLKDDLDERVFDLLKEHFNKNKMPIEGMMKFKPGLIAMTLVSMELMKLGFSPEYGIDFFFVEKAKEKEIVELETMEEQLSLLSDTSHGNLLLEDALLGLADMKQKMDDIILAWETGDFDKMNNLIFKEPLEKHPEFLPVFKEMFFDRNEKMAQKIVGFLKTKKTYFVVVGAGHLVGDKSILNILKQAKYSVSQL
jgi:uncharacterized protein YbaP (TraB family)